MFLAGELFRPNEHIEPDVTYPDVTSTMVLPQILSQMASEPGQGTHMKKIVIALFASIALVLGTGALVSSASAAYPNTVKTTTSVSAKSSVNEGKKFTVKVKVRAGNARVSNGVVKVTFDGKKYTRAAKGGSVSISVRAPKVKKTTRKTIKVTYTASGSSVFKDSSDSTSIKVKNKK
jgi:hypothetical protein